MKNTPIVKAGGGRSLLPPVSTFKTNSSSSSSGGGVNIDVGENVKIETPQATRSCVLRAAAG